jgi:ABC-type phosphate/phosphonate transport system substrate-binding protein
VRGLPLGRRKFLAFSAGSAVAAMLGGGRAGASDADVIRFGLTPVLLTSDLDLLDLLKSYLEKATSRSVQLVTRRTYEEISALLISSQLDGAWICSPPFLTYRTQLELLAVPLWNGKPLYRSYLIADAKRLATSIDDLSGDIHAFSDPNSNSGFVATAAELAAKGLKPERFFRQIFFTYGHENVVRAVASGLAQSGSVDGYVYEVLKEVEPALTQMTRVVRPSPWFGFPPIAGPLAAIGTENRDRLRHALLTAHQDELGQQLLKMLRLDAFADEPASVFDSVAANMALIRKLA